MMSFRRFGCGCIGLGTDILIKPCDTGPTDPEYCCFRRPALAEKGSRPLSDDEIDEVMRDLNDLIHDGYRLRTIKAALYPLV